VEDLDLGRRIARLGDVAKTPASVARIRVGRQGSTGDWSKLPRLWNLSREKVFNQPGSLARLRHSAGSDSYVRGRVSRMYLASLVFNLRHKGILAALNRATSLVALTGIHTLSGSYWRGLRFSRPMESR